MTTNELELLASVADAIKTGNELMGSKWQKAECEVIAAQTVCACAANLKEHGDAFSWLGKNAKRGRQSCGTDNAKGLQRLIDDGSLTVEPYRGDLAPPDDVATDDGLPLVLRCTDSLIYYVASEVL